MTKLYIITAKVNIPSIKSNFHVGSGMILSLTFVTGYAWFDFPLLKKSSPINRI